MAMLKSEQESIDMSKAMMQSLQGCSMGGEYLNGLSIPQGNESPSPTNISMPQAMNDLLGGLVNPSQLMANNMDGSAMVSNLLEQMLHNQFLSSQQSLPFLSNQSIPSSTPSKEVYCDLCDKVFANRLFLRNHRMNKHGIDEEGSPIKGIEGSSSPIENMEGGRNSSVIRERCSVEGSCNDREATKDDENGMSRMEMDEMSASSTVSKCDECPFETDNFLSLIQHKASSHIRTESEQVNTVTPPSSFSCSECDQSFESAALLANHTTFVHGQLSNLLNMFGGDANSFPAFLLNSQLPNPFSSLTNTPPMVKPPPPKRNYSSAGKNYCDVCNKEVCNKYFLRTHMLKMHGIVIDENKPVIANIDTRERERTGELTFRCDICSTTLTSRQQLRDHKHTVHGVSYPVGTPSTPSVPPTLSTLSTTLSTPTRPIKTSVVQSPSMSTPSLTNASISTMDLSSLPPESSSSSSIDHTITSIPSIPSLNIIPDLMSGLPSASVVRETKELNGIPLQNLTKCQHCVYTTRFARNMEYHVERHERLNDVDGVRSDIKMEMVDREEEKMMDRSCDDVIMRMTTNAAIQMAKTNESSSFQCTKCDRSFTTQSFLHSHTQLYHSQKMMNNLAAWIAHKRKTSSTKLRLKNPKRLKNVLKKNCVVEKENDIHGVERHSVTSGSISPLRCEVPEGISSCENGYSLQSVVITTPLGCPLPSQFTARLPISSPIQSPLTLTLTLTPLIS